MNTIKQAFDFIINTIIDIIYLFKRNKIFISGYIQRNYGKIEHNNWGDDINIFFLKDILNCNPLPKDASILYKLLPVKNYLCIGSVLGWYDNKYMEVWGSGLISPNEKVYKKIRCIHSVRGPLTREVLLSQNIDCPERYGDPALLISKFYKPNTNKRYKLGIIPHFADYDSNCFKKFKHDPDILFIKMKGYKDWHDIPNQICSCERIISSSLHGLIIADSYNIPNLWVKFSNNIRGNNFKYHDYYCSVGRYDEKPISINTQDDIIRVLDSNTFKYSENIDYESIIDTCPFRDKIRLNLTIK